MINCFLSVGRVETERHKRFLKALEMRLNADGITFLRARNSPKAPLLKIEQEMRRSDATLIVAHERYRFEKVTEFPGSKQNEREISGQSLPTVWNHIEAILAVKSEHPLLVLCEEGIRAEGMLEPIGSYYIHTLDFDESVVDTKDFDELISEWKEDIKQNMRKRQSPIRVVFRSFSNSFLDGLNSIAPLVGIVAILLGFAFWLGQVLA
mgnify:CR=1 FL=1